jgi:hypothetical protein
VVIQETEEEIVKEIEYQTEPEKFRQGIYDVREFFNSNKLFCGVFRDGKIEGVYFSNGLIDARRIFSIVKVKGEYSLNEGTLKLIIARSNYFYIMHILLLVFGVVVTTMIFFDDGPPKTFIVFPWFIVLMNYVIYFFGYRSREMQIIQNFEHFLGVGKDLLD